MSCKTYLTLQAALVGLSLYPDVLKRAQAELDDVVGGDRLPLFSDLDSLEYVCAIVKEAFRGKGASDPESVENLKIMFGAD